jgi:ribosomal protein S21
MSHDKIGPKERMLREMREQRFARKPSKVELRERVAKIKAVPKNRSRRGR